MLLNRLIEQQNRLIEHGDISPIDDYEPIRVGFVLMLTTTGAVHSLISGGENEHINAPGTERTSGVLGGLLYDHPDYALGVPVTPKVAKTGKKTPEQQAAERLGTFGPVVKTQGFLETLWKVVESVKAAGESYPVLDAMVRFYMHGHREAFLADDLSAPIRAAVAKGEKPYIFFALKTGRSHQIAVQTPGLDAHLVHNKLDAASTSVVQCSVTGATGPIGDKHGYVFGVVGGQTSGCKLVSFNGGLFDSYGMRDEQNGPVSPAVARGYHRGLNHMLTWDSPNHIRVGNGKKIGDHSIIAWGTSDEVTVKGTLYEAPEDQLNKLRRLIRASRIAAAPQGITVEREDEGGDTPAQEDVMFCVLMLKANSARLSPIFWEEMTGEMFLDRAERWFADMALVPPSEKVSPYLSIPQLVSALASPSQKPDQHMMGGLFRTAIEHNGHVDVLVLDAALRAFKTTLLGYLNAPRFKPGEKGLGFSTRMFRIIALAKLAVARGPYPRSHPVSLDPTRETIPYNYGRLFAVYERVQRYAVQGINTTILSRVAGAMETPSLEFSHLSQKNLKHLSMLKRRGKVYVDMIEQIFGNISDVPPRMFTAEEQVEFMIGYWHQRVAINDLFPRKPEGDDQAGDDPAGDDPAENDDSEIDDEPAAA